MKERPLGPPLEPGSDAGWANAVPKNGRDVARRLPVADCASGNLDAERLQEVCHDMRQPIAGIMVLADAALCRSAIPLPVRECLEQLRGQAQWLGDLLQHVIEPDSGQTAAEEPPDLARLAFDAAQAERVTYRGDLVLLWSGGHLHVLGNSVEIRRTIANLLSNATRAAGPDGTVIIELHRLAERVLLTVDDSGPGFGLIRPGSRLGLQVITRSLNSCGGRIGYGRSRTGGVRAVLALQAAEG